MTVILNEVKNLIETLRYAQSDNGIGTLITAQRGKCRGILSINLYSIQNTVYSILIHV